jgi:hypothetical protein
MLDSGGKEGDRLMARTRLRALADDWLVERRRAVGQVPAVEWTDRRPFHWALEFPEAIPRAGFDAIVGNPPFQGGKKISGALGGHYRDYLVTQLAGEYAATQTLSLILPARRCPVALRWGFRVDCNKYARSR